MWDKQEARDILPSRLPTQDLIRLHDGKTPRRDDPQALPGMIPKVMGGLMTDPGQRNDDGTTVMDEISNDEDRHPGR